MKKIAVTGGVASGKSTFCRLMAACGATVVSADAIVHQLLKENPVVKQKIIDLLGSTVLRDGELDRKVMADSVFVSSEKLRGLEAILHPAVRAEIARRAAECTAPLFVAEIPLLFEGNHLTPWDATVCIACPPEQALARFVAGGGTPADFARRSGQQLPPEEKAARATYVIDNDGDLELFESEVRRLYGELTR